MKCQSIDCNEEANPCFLPDDDMQPQDSVPAFWYCSAHMATNGFCPSCGQFWGGVESFEMSGICDVCREVLDYNG